MISNRWSQLVRTPGAVQVISHHQTEVPPLGAEPPYTETRPGLRILCRPVSSPDLPWAIDITSTAAQAMLEGFLRTGTHVGLRLGWRSRGFGVNRRDTIHLRPLKPGE